ncbi:MAG: class I SAM-dependent methyltransferase [Deltaproteobacteria bacterium]|nr:class I SAM-dependent methyltransferase [Deltaproteobacteria bacterium]
MKILETRPQSYDRRMDEISRARVREMKQAVAHEIQPGARVLEIGCGTGELAVVLVKRGAIVEGFDLSPGMVEEARKRIEAESLQDLVNVYQMGVDGMDSLPGLAYGAIVSTLVFSELTDDERWFALKHSFRVLKPDGLLVLADEVVPSGKYRRTLHAFMRLPILVLTYLVSRASTRPLADLREEVTAAGFAMEKEVRSCGDTFSILVARRPVPGDAG